MGHRERHHHVGPEDAGSVRVHGEHEVEQVGLEAEPRLTPEQSDGVALELLPAGQERQRDGGLVHELGPRRPALLPPADAAELPDPRDLVRVDAR
jgi:hypothetical protein